MNTDNQDKEEKMKKSEQVIIDHVHFQLIKMLEVVPKDRRSGLKIFVHKDNSLVCANFSGSFFELKNGKSKPNYFSQDTSVEDVYKMCKHKGYAVERDAVGWLKIRL